MATPLTEADFQQSTTETPQPSPESDLSKEPSYLDFIGITDNKYMTPREKKFMRWVSRNTGIKVEESRVLNQKTGQEESEGKFLSLEDPGLAEAFADLIRPVDKTINERFRLSFDDVLTELYLRKHGIDEEKKGLRKVLKRLGKLIKNNMLAVVDGAVDVLSGDFLSRGIKGDGHCLDWAVTMATVVHVGGYRDVPADSFEVVPYNNERPEGQNYSPLLGHDHYGIRYVQDDTEMLGIYPGIVAPRKVIQENTLISYFAERDAAQLERPVDDVLAENRAQYEKMAIPLRNLLRTYTDYNRVKEAQSLAEVANTGNQ